MAHPAFSVTYRLKRYKPVAGAEATRVCGEPEFAVETPVWSNSERFPTAAQLAFPLAAIPVANCPLEHVEGAEASAVAVAAAIPVGRSPKASAREVYTPGVAEAKSPCVVVVSVEVTAALMLSAPLVLW